MPRRVRTRIVRARLVCALPVAGTGHETIIPHAKLPEYPPTHPAADPLGAAWMSADQLNCYHRQLYHCVRRTHDPESRIVCELVERGRGAAVQSRSSEGGFFTSGPVQVITKEFSKTM